MPLDNHLPSNGSRWDSSSTCTTWVLMHCHFVLGRRRLGRECTPRHDINQNIHEGYNPDGTRGGANTLAGRGNPSLKPTPPPIVSSVSNKAEDTATRDAEEAPKAESDEHVYYTVRVVKAKSTHPQSETLIGVIGSMRGTVTVETKLYFRERRCCIPMRRLIHVT